MAEQQMISTLASSSNSSTTMTPKEYDVFLSFRGEDTRRNFTCHLYEALKHKKVETYIDEHLEKGDEISQALIKAIEDSHVSIVVFSENYASSKWCLGELIKILDCKKDQEQIVIPVFYNIDPSHVRKQTGSYEQAFAKHEGEPNCNKWKAALTEAANLTGWDSQTYRTDSELLKDIVRDVLKKLPPKYQNQCKGLVGIEVHCKQESLLKIGPSEVRTIGIWGMGGTGKTILATTLYDKLSHEFEDSCFMINVREKSEKLGNHSFEKSDMNRLRGKKALIVLDDVATSKQLEKLKVDYDFLKPGSRVIVTTRNREILGPIDEIYHVNELSSHYSLQLFCLIVFGDEQPKYGYRELSERVVSYCKGIPLALKVLGAFLRPKSKKAWESELEKLQKIPNMEIHEVLKVSYDGLDCSLIFFRGEERDKVTRLLDAFDFFAASGIEVLLDKSLITISKDNRIEMNDLTQEMAREIVYQECIKDPGRQSRLWRHEDAHDVLKYNRGTDVVEGIILHLEKFSGDLCLSSNSLAKMTNLRFLKIHSLCESGFNVSLPTGLESLPEKLRYLEWNKFCLESLPSKFCPEQLVELRMCSSNLKRLWDGAQNLVNLKIIVLDDSEYLIEITDLSKAEKLEEISLRFCRSLHQLHVHSKSLRRLNIEGCSSLKECSLASEKLKEMNLSWTGVRALSSSIWLQRKVTFLSLCDFENLEFAGNNIVHLSSLEVLDLSWTSIESLPALPASLKQFVAINCFYLGTNFTQQLVLQHMLHSHIPYLHQQHLNDPRYDHSAFFLFPADHVIDKSKFYREDSSITIPYLPKCDLCGFVYCIILCEGSNLGLDYEFSCSIYQDGEKVVWCNKTIRKYFGILSSDHVLFGYLDIIKSDRKCEVSDYFSNIRFEFKHVYARGDCTNVVKIKGCGIFPIYTTASGFKPFSCNDKEIFEWRSDSNSTHQISNDESQTKENDEAQPKTKFGASNYENDEDI